MKTLTYSISIEASRQKVWDVLFGQATYPQWTLPFCEGSRAITDWKKGSKALFVDGNDSGMVSEIAESIPYEFLSIRHLGEVKNGVEDTSSDKVKQWAKAPENYKLETVDGKTRLDIYTEMPEAFVDYMDSTWPKALSEVKRLSEEKG